MNEELLPCPFCGRVPPEPKYWRGGDEWTVRCHWDCPSNTVGTRDAVIEAWNTRQHLPRTAAQKSGDKNATDNGESMSCKESDDAAARKYVIEAFMKISDLADRAFGRPYDYTAKCGDIAKEAIAALNNMGDDAARKPSVVPDQEANPTYPLDSFSDSLEFKKGGINIMGDASTRKDEAGSTSAVITSPATIAEAQDALLNLKLELQRNKLQEWQACYAALFNMLNPVMQENARLKAAMGDGPATGNGKPQEDALGSSSPAQTSEVSDKDKLAYSCRAHLDHVYLFSQHHNCDNMVSELAQHYLRTTEPPVSLEKCAIAASRWRNGTISTTHWDEFREAERKAYRDQAKAVLDTARVKYGE